MLELHTSQRQVLIDEPDVYGNCEAGRSLVDRLD